MHQKDLLYIRKGQAAVISAGGGLADAGGRIAYVGPLVGEQTRTALARVILPNDRGDYRPGLFVTAHVMVDETDIPLLVRKSSIQNIHDRASIFVWNGSGFELRHVETGLEDEDFLEITSGLEPGQIYAAKGAFTLKAQLGKGSFGHGHVH